LDELEKLGYLRLNKEGCSARLRGAISGTKGTTTKTMDTKSKVWPLRLMELPLYKQSWALHSHLSQSLDEAIFEHEFERAGLTSLPLSHSQNLLDKDAKRFWEIPDDVERDERPVTMVLIQFWLQINFSACLEILTGTSIVSERAKDDLTSGGNT
jgi:hypothetical protein